jgi:hypothetical protein
MSLASGGEPRRDRVGHRQKRGLADVYTPRGRQERLKRLSEDSRWRKQYTHKKIANGGSSLSEVNTGFHGVDLMGIFRQAHRCGVEAKLLEALRRRAGFGVCREASPAMQHARHSKLGESPDRLVTLEGLKSLHSVCRWTCVRAFSSVARRTASRPLRRT